jgi:hypothetical protein
MTKTLVHAHLIRRQLRRGSEPVIALCCSHRRKQDEPGASASALAADARASLKSNPGHRPNRHPHRSLYRIRTSLASAPAQRLF